MVEKMFKMEVNKGSKVSDVVHISEIRDLEVDGMRLATAVEAISEAKTLMENIDSDTNIAWFFVSNKITDAEGKKIHAGWYLMDRSENSLKEVSQETAEKANWMYRVYVYESAEDNSDGDGLRVGVTDDVKFWIAGTSGKDMVGSAMLVPESSNMLRK